MGKFWNEQVCKLNPEERLERSSEVLSFKDLLEEAGFFTACYTVPAWYHKFGML
jgi:hypothetical protein